MPFKDKEVKAAYQKSYYLNHREANRELANKKNREHYYATLEYQKLRSKKYYESHKLERHQARLKRKELRNLTERNRYIVVKNNPQYKISKNLRTRLYLALKNNVKKGSSVKDLGCSIIEFKIYLSKKFIEGMSWDNYGLWHIDHITPLDNFNLEDKEQFLKACHYTNLQPLWAKDNLRKSNKVSSY